MAMTAREVRAAFEKNRVREEDLEGLSLVLFWSIPEMIEARPEWLDQPLAPASVCMLQLDAFRCAVQSRVMLQMIYDNSARLRSLFKSSQTYLEAGVIASAAQQKIEDIFVGVVMVELDQLSATNRDLSSEQQVEFFDRASKPWVTKRFRAGLLTVQMMIEHDPGSLLVKWDPSGL